jgi:hypothetical protein
MKSIYALAAGVALLALSACGSTQQANLNTAVANLNQTNLIALQTISNGCKIVQPALTAASPASPDVAAAAAVNGVVCATADVAATAASAVVAAQAPVAAPASAPVAASAPASK